MSGPTQRSLKYLRKRGYLPGVVERTSTFAGGKRWTPGEGGPPPKKHDLYGVIDIVATVVKVDFFKDPFTKATILGVQTTSASNLAARVTKLREAKFRLLDDGPEEPLLPMLLAAGWEVHVHGWRKLKSTGRWAVRVWDMRTDKEVDA